MAERGYLKRWILPLDSLYQGYSGLQKSYGGHPICNSPELNPWGLHLNQTVHIDYDTHCQVTENHLGEHPLKFLGSETFQILYSYHRLLDKNLGRITPPEWQILQDINRPPKSLQQIYEANGIFIEDSANDERSYTKKIFATITEE